MNDASWSSAARSGAGAARAPVKAAPFRNVRRSITRDTPRRRNSNTSDEGPGKKFSRIATRAGSVLNFVRTLSLVALVVAAGCAPRPPIEEPTIKSVPPQLIADSGASLYIFECPDDFLDDNSMLFQRAPDEKDDPPVGPKPSSNTQSLGEQAFEWVLRHSLSQKQGIVSFIGHADFQPLSGWPMEVTLFNPDALPATQRAEKVGFHVRFTASSTDNPNYVNIEWETEKLTDTPGPKNEPGKISRAKERIAGGSCKLPVRATLLMHHRREGSRMYLVLLRITSLKEP